MHPPSLQSAVTLLDILDCMSFVRTRLRGERAPCGDRAVCQAQPFALTCCCPPLRLRGPGWTRDAVF